MKAAIVDASVWVSRFIPQDAYHEVSHRWLEGHIRDGNRLIAPFILPIEVAGAVARRTGKLDLAHQTIHDFMRLPSLRLLIVNERLSLQAAQLAVDLRLRGADAVYVAVAHRFNIPLITWDIQQRERAGTLIKAYTPAEVLGVN